MEVVTGRDYPASRWCKHWWFLDPLAMKTGTPYVYANGAPTALSDPSGLSPLDACADFGGVGAFARAVFDCWTCAVGSLVHAMIQTDYISKYPYVEAEKYYRSETGNTGRIDLVDPKFFSFWEIETQY